MITRLVTFYARRIVNVNVNIVLAGLLALGPTLLVVRLVEHLLAKGYQPTQLQQRLHLSDKAITGKEADAALGKAHITVNKNAVPNDPRPPMVTSGIRIGTPAGTTRGFKQAEFEQIADWIADVLDSNGSEAAIEKARAAVSELCRRYPVYGP